jgi:hypothetical protein
LDKFVRRQRDKCARETWKGERGLPRCEDAGLDEERGEMVVLMVKEGTGWVRGDGIE